MQPRRFSSVVAGTMIKIAPPYRIILPTGQASENSAYIALKPWLFSQIIAHIFVLLSYGTCLVLLALLSLYMTAEASNNRLAPFATFVACSLVFVSVWRVFARARQRERSLWNGEPIAAYDLLHEWLHYGFGAILCAGLTAMSLFFLPALAFCIYSLVCLVKIANASSLERE
jgi:hypothetical protein